MTLELARKIVAEYSFMPDSRIAVDEWPVLRSVSLFRLWMGIFVPDSDGGEEPQFIQVTDVITDPSEAELRDAIAALCWQFHVHEFHEWFRRGGCPTA